jgi:Protein of unknown function (DUF3224)
MENMHIEATFEIGGWDEAPFDEAVGVAKLTRASVTKTYHGDIEATSATEWLMAYQPDKTATFVGLERIRGTIGGRHGSLVLQHAGTFAGGAATGELTVVSGTDELKGAAGSGSFKADPAGSITLDLTLAPHPN